MSFNSWNFNDKFHSTHESSISSRQTNSRFRRTNFLFHKTNNNFYPKATRFSFCEALLFRWTSFMYNAFNWFIKSRLSVPNFTVSVILFVRSVHRWIHEFHNPSSNTKFNPRFRPFNLTVRTLELSFHFTSEHLYQRFSQFCPTKAYIFSLRPTKITISTSCPTKFSLKKGTDQITLSTSPNNFGVDPYKCVEKYVQNNMHKENKASMIFPITSVKASEKN